MDGSSGAQGIERLLQAEKRAAEIVHNAKQDKARKVKEAKAEAEAEIASFRAAREAEFQKFKTESMGGTGSSRMKLNQDTDMFLHKIEGDAARTRQQVTQKICDLVMRVDTTCY
mmetsp:Transcript_6926/g.15930  ORF Transcript_6926/g.15930 Transcript_6926/m.15930 type:complete len:114 (-) Transcript_6926:187-528(-)|eukprot:CAMPEP_0114548886 /NCGR_PEP_ID=MMETSP0114-20121206/5228_1 /TAXON_ID=31324 /ORGANISM="Goniomonas sp, Strain m" /LENGTH=113 /DNA_ID=CAMNT_0001733521 /DNA_START=17 /DNA_END=358 /DNA_ORIENTATION=-